MMGYLISSNRSKQILLLYIAPFLVYHAGVCYHNQVDPKQQAYTLEQESLQHPAFFRITRVQTTLEQCSGSAQNNRQPLITDCLQLTLELPNDCEQDKSEQEKNATIKKKFSVFLDIKFYDHRQSPRKLCQCSGVQCSPSKLNNILNKRGKLELYSSLIFDQFYSIYTPRRQESKKEHHQVGKNKHSGKQREKTTLYK